MPTNSFGGGGIGAKTNMKDGYYMEDMNEVFNNPSVVEVVFEIRFPNLFFIAQNIGGFQLEIMDEFPKSSQIIAQSVVIGGDKASVNGENIEKPTTIWQFENETGKTKISIRSNRLNIISQEYKSYNNPDVDNRFRDLITGIVPTFLKIVPIKNFSRIGIRYIDHCPLEKLNNEYFKTFYIPIIDINTYKIEDTIENYVSIRTKRDDYYLLFQCGIRQFEGKYKYYLDYDGYANNIEADNFIGVADELQKMIKKEYYLNITEEFKQYMRADTHES